MSLQAFETIVLVACGLVGIVALLCFLAYELRDDDGSAYFDGDA